MCSLAPLMLAVAALLMSEAANAAPKWREGPKNKPTACGTLWRTIGLPQHDTTNRSLTFVCHRRFILLHDNVNKTPDWVIERLNRKTTKAPPKKGAAKKNDPSRKGLAFVQEKLIPPVGRASNGDYTNPKANLDRGHMAASENFNRSAADMKTTFVYSNAVPQVGDRFNGSIWKDFEAEVRKIAITHGDTFVITGPVRRTPGHDTVTVNACDRAIELKGPHPREKFVCKDFNNKPDAFCDKGVSVPIGVYKIVYVRATRTAYAFVLPNIDHDTGGDQPGYLDTFRISIPELERITNLKFFRELAAESIGTGAACAPGRPWVTP